MKDSWGEIQPLLLDGVRFYPSDHVPKELVLPIWGGYLINTETLDQLMDEWPQSYDDSFLRSIGVKPCSV